MTQRQQYSETTECPLKSNLSSNEWKYQQISRYCNSLWPSVAIWQHRSGSTLAQVMACCLTAPSHYLHQCWLIISGVQWHPPEGNVTGDVPSIIKISLTFIQTIFHIKSSRGLWDNQMWVTSWLNRKADSVHAPKPWNINIFYILQYFWFGHHLADYKNRRQ